jgi:hypothetical protein
VFSPDGQTAYVYSPGSPDGSVSAVRMSDNGLIATLPMPGGVGGIALTGDGARLAVARLSGPTVTLIDTTTNTVTSDVTLPVNGPTLSVAANASSRVYAGRSGAIQMVDVSPAGYAGDLLAEGAFSLATNPARDRLFAALTPAQPTRVAAIDLGTSSVVSTALVRGPAALAAPAASPAIVADGCTYALSFRPADFTAPVPLQSPAGSSAWRIDVIALPDRCAWTAQSDAAWVTFEFASGTGPDNVGITIAPNGTGVVRTATLTIGGQTLTLQQAGCSNPIVFFERPSASGVVAQPYMVSGWGIDTCSTSGTGLVAQSAALGYGLARPDVAAAFAGLQFTNSGFEFRDTIERRPGVQDISFTFYSTITGNAVVATTRVNIQSSIAPFGFIDTPAEGATVSGDMALTGWVMDDVGILGNLLIYRDALAGEPSSPGTPGKVFIGVATRVAGARPDVQAIFPNYADNDRAGFGAMILTNALPNGGNGTFTFHIQVADQFNAVWLGPRTVTVNNASSPLPFGAVDTPQPGQTVSGIITVYGWALTPGANTIPLDGSTIEVFVDGVFVGHPSYNEPRPDVQALFPGYTNSAGPGGHLNFDTRTLSNGLHTIAWVVRDTAGNAKGIGSRYFTVANP